MNAGFCPIFVENKEESEEMDEDDSSISRVYITLILGIQHINGCK